MAAFAPGQAVRTYAEGTAIKIPAGATLVFQMHYTAGGKPTTDRSRIGMVFAKEPPRQQVMIAALQNANFTLPAGAPDVQVDAEMTLDQDVTIWSMLPHTHVRGKRWHLEAIYPDGRTETILDVPKYDFNWQTDYVFKQPLKLPKDTKIRTTAWYDNSAAQQIESRSDRRRPLGRSDVAGDAVHRVRDSGGSATPQPQRVGRREEVVIQGLGIREGLRAARAALGPFVSCRLAQPLSALSPRHAAF